MEFKKGCIGYYSEPYVDECGNKGFVLDAHDPETQKALEKALREGTRRRTERERARQERDDIR